MILKRKRYLLASLALVGALFNLSLVASLLSQATPVEQSKKNKPDHSDKHQEPEKQTAGTSSKLENTPAVQGQGSLGTKDSANKSHEEDVELQGKLVTFTLWLVVVGGLQFAALVVQAIVFWRTLKAIRGQLELMKAGGADTQDLAQQAVRQTELIESQLILSHRPWVAADVAIGSNLVFDQRGAVAAFNVTIRNLGHSVARNVSLWTAFVVAGIQDLNQSHEELCGIMKRPENEKSDYGWMLFPGQQVIEPRPVIANLADVEKGLKTGHFKDVAAIGLHLIGCVDYQSSFDIKKHHQTRFIYLLGRIDPQKGGAVMGTFVPQNKSYDKIILTPTMHGTSAD